MVRPFGPMARELPLSRMALLTEWVVKGERLWSSGQLRRRSLLILRAVGSEVCGITEVNCLLKEVAIAWWLESGGSLLKLIGWLGVLGGRLPERDFSRDQKRVG